MEIFSLTGVLTNDVDADGDSLVAILDTPPKNGILDLQGSGAFDYTANNCAVDDQFTYRVTDGQNESNAARVFLNAPGIPEAVPWYPVFCWDSIPKANTSSPYAWYHVQVIADETPDIPFFATNVQGDSLNDREYFLANFSGFPPGSYTAGYRYWHPAEDQYGDFLPLAIKNAGKGDSWVLTYPEADEPSSLTIETCDPGIYLLSFIVGNAQGYEVKVEGMDGDFSRVWRHIFIPGENTDRVQCVLGGNTMFKALRLARIPVDDLTTLKVDLTIPGTYEVSVRGFNPKDDQEGLPEYKIFSDLIIC